MSFRQKLCQQDEPYIVLTVYELFGLHGISMNFELKKAIELREDTG
jgi:hypothetical protein